MTVQQWDWSLMIPVLVKALQETGLMIGLALIPTVVLGLAIGVLLVATNPGGVLAEPFGSARLGRIINQVLGFVVNVGRSLPFIILMVLVIPFTRLVVGTFIGPVGASVPLAIAAIPFFARLVEIALNDVDKGIVEAAKSLGASRWTIIWKVLLAEGRGSIVLGFSTSVVSLLNYSAIAGSIGAGGIGDVAIRYGYQMYSIPYLVTTVVLLIVIVQIVQGALGLVARRISHR